MPIMTSYQFLRKVFIPLTVVFLSWKTYIILKCEPPEAPPPVDLEHFDYSLVDNVTGTFRVIDTDTEVVISPVKEQGDLYMIILVLSAPANFVKRQKTRQVPWRPANVPDGRGGVKLVFLIGAVDDAGLQENIAKEAEEFGDILQLGLMDGYVNLPYKTIAGFIWAAGTYSPRYLLKADDDIFVDPTRLVDIMEAKFPADSIPSTDTIHCVLFRNFRPERRTDGVNKKWSVSAEIYPRTKYPPYCNGWLYVLDVTLAKKIAIAATETPYHFVDDIYVTGLARERVGGSKVEYLATGRVWTWVWTHWLSQCPLFGLIYHHLLPEVSNVEDNNPVRIFYCIGMEYFLGMYVCTNMATGT